MKISKQRPDLIYSILHSHRTMPANRYQLIRSLGTDTDDRSVLTRFDRKQ